MKINTIPGLFKENSVSFKKIDRNFGFKQLFDIKMNEITAAANSASARSRTRVIERGNKLLDLLDDYARKLTHPSRTLKEIDPLVKRIERELSGIESEFSGKTFTENGLEKIINDLVVTAHVAAFKFRRGDYT